MKASGYNNTNTKIGILTMFYNNSNFGGQLQAYALQSFLESMGFDARQVKFKYVYPNSCSQHKYNFSFKAEISKLSKKILRKYYSRKLKNRKEAFNIFMDMIPSSEKVYDENNVMESVNDYDTFICGGDQIWNNWEVYGSNTLKRYTLDFVPETKLKFSYAASLGRRSGTEEYLKKLKPGLESLDAISVRERSGAAILTQVTEKKISVVVDPVMLFNGEQWSEKIKKQKWRNGNYLLCYFLGRNRTVKRTLSVYAKKRNIKIITLPFVADTFSLIDIFFGDVKDFSSGPLDFVSLIRNADCIFTDSFHAVLFSVLFEKKFWVFDRNENVSGSNMNSRIFDFLNRYGLETRYLPDDSIDRISEHDSIDYSEIMKKVEDDRNESIKFLKELLIHES